MGPAGETTDGKPLYWACPECGCTDVQGTAWYEINQGLMTADEGPLDDYWCPGCSDHYRSLERVSHRKQVGSPLTDEAWRALAYQQWESEDEQIGGLDDAEAQVSIPALKPGETAYAWVQAWVRVEAESPECGHSACRQHWIDSGSPECVAEEEA